MKLRLRLCCVLGLLFWSMTSCDSGFKRDGIRYTIQADGLVVMPTQVKEYVGDIKIPDSVVYHGKKYAVLKISTGAFENCKLLKSVVIPATVKEIGSNAFAQCLGLQVIHCRVEAPVAIDSTTFEGVSLNKCVLSVPLQMAKSYANAPYWNQFSIYEEGEVVDLTTLPATAVAIKVDDHGE